MNIWIKGGLIVGVLALSLVLLWNPLIVPFIHYLLYDPVATLLIYSPIFQLSVIILNGNIMLIIMRWLDIRRNKKGD